MHGAFASEVLGDPALGSWHTAFRTAVPARPQPVLERLRRMLSLLAPPHKGPVGVWFMLAMK